MAPPRTSQRLAAYRGSVSIDQLERAGATAAWISAALRGVCGVEHVLDVISGLDDAATSPSFLTINESDATSLAFAIAGWRRRGIVGWRYLPVAPGDAVPVERP